MNRMLTTLCVATTLAAGAGTATAGNQSSNTSSNTSSNSSNGRTVTIHREERSFSTDRGQWRSLRIERYQTDRRRARRWRDADDD